MDEIINRMRTSETLAGWTAAADTLAKYDGDAQLACLALQHMVQMGLTQTEADLLKYYVGQLAKEI